MNAKQSMRNKVLNFEIKMGSLLLVFLLPPASIELLTAPALILPLLEILS